jgi:hypothetical protein
VISRPADGTAGAFIELVLASGEVVQRVVSVNVNSRQYVARVDIISQPGPGPLLVQKTQGANGAAADTPLTVALSTPVVQGHLIILAFHTSGTGNHLLSGTGGSGWTRIAGDGTRASIYWKVASSGDAALSPFTVTVDDDTAVSITRKAFLLEYEQMAAAPADVGASANSAGSVVSQTSGTTAATAQANELALAIFGQGSGGTTNQAWTNGFSQLDSVSRGWLVWKHLSAAGAVETTQSWTTSASMQAAIATFKAAQAAAGPISPRQLSTRFVEFEVAAAQPFGGSPRAIVELDLNPVSTAARFDVHQFDSSILMDYNAPSYSEDITKYVQFATSDRGSAREQERVEAGVATFSLRNNDERFTPFNPSSPYHPNILPMRRIRIRAEWLGQSYPIFTGFVEGWPVRFTDAVNQMTEIQAVDGFKLLSLAKVSGSFPQQQSGARIAAILTAAGWPSSERDLDVGNATVPAVTLENASALEHIQRIMAAEGGRFFIGRDGRAVFRDGSPTLPPTFSDRTWANDGTGMPYGDDVILPVDDSLIFNEVRLSRDGGAEQVAESQQSQQQYGRRTYPVDSDVQLSSDAQVLSLAEEKLRRHSEPALRLEHLTDRAVRHGKWHRVLPRELADIVLAIEERNGVSQVSAIEGLHHEIHPGFRWEISLDLSPSNAGVHGVFDHPVLGKFDSGNVFGR